MSKIKVGTITNVDDTSPVIFPTGVSGDGSGLTFEPKVVSFNPEPLSSGISTTTNINVTFDQQIEFSGVGTIYIRESSASGTISTYFTCGVSTEATIVGETLIIDPVNPIDFAKTYYVTLPSVGIANTYGAYYKGTVNYQFQTTIQSFTAQGGDHEFTIASAPSPTGYYRYHVFTSTGILTTTDSTVNADSLSAMIVAGGGAGGWDAVSPYAYGGGGGGAGGLLSYTGPTLALGAGTYAITIGAGGNGTTSQQPLGYAGNGNDSTISTPTSTIITVYGGGSGAVYDGNPNPITGLPSFNGTPGGSGGGGANPSSGFVAGTGVPGQGNPGGVGTPPGQFGGGGGGGAGGAGQTSPAPGGAGGPGAPNPAFTSPLIAPYVPTIPPASFPEIGPTGLYAGGGAGYPYNTGGPGGGGNSYDGNLSLQLGSANTGGGGGATYRIPLSSYGPTNGGSGVFMIRYAVSAP